MTSPGNEVVTHSEMKDKETNKIVTWRELRESRGNVVDGVLRVDNERYSKIDNGKCELICVEYDVDKILQDTLKECYVAKRKLDFYKLRYHEFVIPSLDFDHHFCVIFNSLDMTFTPVDELIDNKILMEDQCGGGLIHTRDPTDIRLVDGILKSLISGDDIRKYKRLMRSIIVEQEEPYVTFYDRSDDGNFLLTRWAEDLLYAISGGGMGGGMPGDEYYKDKRKFNRRLKTTRPRFIIIEDRKENSVEHFRRMGFKNIIVCQRKKADNMYNKEKYRKHLQNITEELAKCIPNRDIPKDLGTHLGYDEDIFSRQGLLPLNFLKWCCVE